jgi:hypothetical protein
MTSYLRQLKMCESSKILFSKTKFIWIGYLPGYFKIVIFIYFCGIRFFFTQLVLVICINDLVTCLLLVKYIYTVNLIFKIGQTMFIWIRLKIMTLEKFYIKYLQKTK